MGEELGESVRVIEYLCQESRKPIITRNVVIGITLKCTTVVIPVFVLIRFHIYRHSGVVLG